MSNFGDRLFEAITEKKSPLCVGLDAHLDGIPEPVKQRAINSSKDGLSATINAIREYIFNIIDAVADIVPVVKPNIAFYEKYCEEGIALYKEVCKYAKNAGLIVMGDVKRGDILTTSTHYADEFLGKVKLIDDTELDNYADSIDAVTVNAFFGEDSTRPFLDYCDNEQGKGAILLCKTSNKSSAQIQDVLTVNGISVCETVADLINEWGSDYIGEKGYSSVLPVVGATSDKQKALRNRMPNNPFLVPGYGAQGATANDIVPSFNGDGSGAIVNASRSVVQAYKREPWKHKFRPDQYADAARASAMASTKEIVGALKRNNMAKIYL
jgi:orotidine-5'-phosphate decarboxylase